MIIYEILDLENQKDVILVGQTDGNLHQTVED